MESVCRLCAKEKPSKQLVHSIEDRSLNIQQKLIDCCRWNSISATESDTLPKNICNACYRKLDMSWSFAENVTDAQQQIFSMCSKENSASSPIDRVDVMDTSAKQKSKGAKLSNERNESKRKLVSKQENINSSDDDEMLPTSNERPKRKPAPLQEKYQAGSNKVKSKASKQPKKNDVGKSKLPRSKKSVCNTCGKEFIGADLLKRHMKIHSDERPHKCKTCGKRFSRKDKLKEHEVTHTGAKPYACHLCEYRCANYSNSLKHMRQKHGVARKTQFLWTPQVGGGLYAKKQVTFYKVDKKNQ